jgi:hypothetical protein
MLKITPPETASDKRTKSYDFVEAVKKFPTNFSAKELGHILPKIGKHQFGSLKSVFICLSDDLKHKPRAPESSEAAEGSTSRDVATDGTVASQESAAAPHDSRRGSGNRNKRGPSPSGSQNKSARR